MAPKKKRGSHQGNVSARKKNSSPPVGQAKKRGRPPKRKTLEQLPPRKTMAARKQMVEEETIVIDDDDDEEEDIIPKDPLAIESPIVIEDDNSNNMPADEVVADESITLPTKEVIREVEKIQVETTSEKMMEDENNIENLESETIEITKKLEELEVEAVVDDNADRKSEGTPVMDEINQEVVEFEGETLEFYNEEIVPTNEVVIEEETSQTSIENDVNYELLKETAAAGVEKDDDDDDNNKKVKIINDNKIEEKDKAIAHQSAIDEKFDKVEEELEKIQEEKSEKVLEKCKKEKKKAPAVAAGATAKRGYKKKNQKVNKASGKKTNTEDENSVRRSNRIKSQNSVQKQKSKGLVKLAKPTAKHPETSDISENSNTSASNNESEKSSATASPSLPSSDYDNNKPVKVKSRWRRSSELEMNVLTPAAQVMENQLQLAEIVEQEKTKSKITVIKDDDNADKQEVEFRLKQFIHLKDNLYLTDRMSCKEAKKMICDCYLSPDEIGRGEFGCGEDCLNRLLMIECSNLCPIRERCTNKKFQKGEFAPVEVFKTEKKGLGLRATANVPYGEFILEYVGEVLDHEEFDVRADDYSNDKNRHYYFMSLRADAIIDATRKGNISRFINHSCEPNAETQKWTVNGELRIGFFSTRTILAGEEITFDYQFQRYGKEAQKCYCEANTCRGWLGEEPDDEDEEEEEEEEGEDDEEVEEDEEEEEEEKDEGEKSERITRQQIKKLEKRKNEESSIETKNIVNIEGDSKVDETSPMIEKKKRGRKKKVLKKTRKDIFEDLDQLDDEIEMLVATGLKNQAHTLKLSRLIVRAKELQQRQKLMRILRRGELPCRRLFLDYHGLKLMHGYMIDAQQFARTDTKYESLRLELLQTLATLPIPNKTMLQDSKVLTTVQKWSNKDNKDDYQLDSDSNSPTDTILITNKTSKQQPPQKQQQQEKEQLNEERNYDEEITSLALKLLEEWSSLKEVFKIPKKERIEQMKEHEREANRGYIAGLGLEASDERNKFDNRYRGWKRFRITEKIDPNNRNKVAKFDDRFKWDKFERRKLFALQEQQREEERRRKQREMWQQHERECILLGTDPRLTAPYDPNRGYQCIWNTQIGQWQNYPLPPQQQQQHHSSSHSSPYLVQQPALPALPYQDEIKKMQEEEDVTNVKFMGPIPPPVKLPSMWKCAKDKYGRPYYYHIRIRKSQWIPPPCPQQQQQQHSKFLDSDDFSSISSSSDESTSSSVNSDTTTSSSSDSANSDSEEEEEEIEVNDDYDDEDDEEENDNEQDDDNDDDDEEEDNDDDDDDDEIDDEKLLKNIRKQLEKQGKLSILKTLQQNNDTTEKSSIEDENIEMKEQKTGKKRRTALVQEILISPRTEEDRLQFKEDLKRYKQNKEKLKKQKEMILLSKKQIKDKDKRNKAIVKAKMKEMIDSNTESSKRIKETFRSNMATFVVNVLNAYRKPECKEGRITNTEDFKHLARKLTHFVMLKEMKHIEKIEELVCTENVKSKAKEYIRKYMSKFGENYQKRNDEPDF